MTSFANKISIALIVILLLVCSCLDWGLYELHGNTACAGSDASVADAMANIDAAGYPQAASQSFFSDPAAAAANMPGYDYRLEALHAISNLATYYVEYWNQNNNGPAWLKRTQISGQFGGTAQWTLSTLQPLNDIEHSLQEVWYVAGNVSSNNATANVGIGYRQMENANSVVYGANAFYDQQFSVSGTSGLTTNGHQRLGGGLEWFYGPLEFTVNGYYGLSPEIIVGTSYPNNIFQKAANGYDYNLKTDFSYLNLPWLNLTATGYQYFGTQANNTWSGGNLQSGSLNAAINVFPQLVVSVSQDFGLQSTQFGFTLNLGAPPRPALFCADAVINENVATDLSYKMMQMPQRNNNITVEQYQKRMPCTVVVPVADNYPVAQPLSGVTVTLTSAPGSAIPTTQTIQSDGNGNATFSVPIAQSYSILVSTPRGYTLPSPPQPVYAAGSTIVPTVVLVPQSPQQLTFAVTDATSGAALTGVSIAVPLILVPIPLTNNGSSVVNNVPGGIAYNGGSATLSGYNNTSIPSFVASPTPVAFTMQCNLQATVTGSVTDNNGNVIPGATLTLSGVGGNFFDTCDANGNFTISNVPYGTYLAVFAASGYTPVPLPGTAVNASSIVLPAQALTLT